MIRHSEIYKKEKFITSIIEGPKMREPEKISMFPVHEYWLDIGQIEQFDQAQRDVSQFS